MKERRKAETIDISGEEFDRDPSGYIDKAEKGDVIRIMRDGKCAMAIVVPQAPPPCRCPRDLRHWVCLQCDGSVATRQQSDGTEKKT